jgi:hypothetical protein
VALKRPDLDREQQPEDDKGPPITLKREAIRNGNMFAANLGRRCLLRRILLL